MLLLRWPRLVGWSGVRPSVCLSRRHTHKGAACEAASVHFGPTIRRTDILVIFHQSTTKKICKSHCPVAIKQFCSPNPRILLQFGTENRIQPKPRESEKVRLNATDGLTRPMFIFGSKMQPNFSRTIHVTFRIDCDVNVYTGRSFVLDWQVVDLQRRVGSVASEPYDVVETVSDSVLLYSDSVIDHSDVVDRKHAPVNLTASITTVLTSRVKVARPPLCTFSVSRIPLHQLGIYGEGL